jgi:hypothetical protein
MNTTLHIPLNKDVKQQAEVIARNQGYSSLQEVLRVFLSCFARGKVHTAFVQSDVVEALTDTQDAYLTKREEETRQAIKEGKAFSARTVKEMMTILENSTHE